MIPFRSISIVDNEAMILSPDSQKLLSRQQKGALSPRLAIGKINAAISSWLKDFDINGKLQFIATHPRWRRLQRTCHNFRITLICGFITLLVLRGTMGAGKFGTPIQDAILRFINGEPASTDIYLQHLDPKFPYSIGPQVKDWDHQRKEHFSVHNVTFPRKLKVMIVSSSPPDECKQNVGDHLLLKALKNRIDYGRLKGIEVFHNMADMDPKMSGSWSKLPLLRRLMLTRPDVDWFWWIEADALISDLKFTIPWKRYKRHSMVIHGDEVGIYDRKEWLALSTGSFMIRNSQWSIDLVDEWSLMGPKGQVRKEAGKILTSKLEGRPDMDADDQSALVYLMNQQRKAFGSKIYIESKYSLYGAWTDISHRLEEIGASSGKGSQRWPFIINYEGCNVCGGFSKDFEVERCITQMNRGFNFGDDQVFLKYGFKHVSLETSALRKLNVTTTISLAESHRLAEIKEALGG